MRRRNLLLVAVGMLVVLAGCGTEGKAPPLGQPATVQLSGTNGLAGSVTFTPIQALHAAVYYRGQAIPVTGAKTPAELRQGSCFGPVIAPLTDGLPAETSQTPAAQPTSASATPAVAQPDPKDGMDVDVATNVDFFVTVRARANDATAPVVACGQPLSALRQFFDLYPPGQLGNTVAIGTALIEPIAATRIEGNVNLPAGSSGFSWEVRDGSCGGSVLARGLLEGSHPQVSGLIFQPLDATKWWLAISNGASQAPCEQVKG